MSPSQRCWSGSKCSSARCTCARVPEFPSAVRTSSLRARQSDRIAAVPPAPSKSTSSAGRSLNRLRNASSLVDMINCAKQSSTVSTASAVPAFIDSESIQVARRLTCFTALVDLSHDWNAYAKPATKRPAMQQTLAMRMDSVPSSSAVTAGAAIASAPRGVDIDAREGTARGVRGICALCGAVGAVPARRQ